jgi:hypothetical protein
MNNDNCPRCGNYIGPFKICPEPGCGYIKEEVKAQAIICECGDHINQGDDDYLKIGEKYYCKICMEDFLENK